MNEEQFADDLAFARRIEIAKFRRRPLRFKIAEQILRLFEPVL